VQKKEPVIKKSRVKGWKNERVEDIINKHYQKKISYLILLASLQVSLCIQCILCSLVYPGELILYFILFRSIREIKYYPEVKMPESMSLNLL
jgi:hypothetical protein